MPTWAEVRDLRPRWVAWALLVVLVLDLRALVHLRGTEPPGCAGGAVPREPTALQTVIALRGASVRAGEDVRLRLRLENQGREPVLVRSLRAVVVAPAGTQVLGWADPPQEVERVLQPGEHDEAALTVHLARCPHASEPLAPGWYELVVVVTQADGARRSSVRPVVVAR